MNQFAQVLDESGYIVNNSVKVNYQGVLDK